MKIVIDIDGTLCSETEDIPFRRPFTDRIKQLNQHYDVGDIICIYTSRGMRSTGNADDSDKKYRAITEKQLAEWGVKYHELIFGKPNADIYIDNKNMLAGDFFYDSTYQRSRDKIPEDLM
jgi:hypothetical protein